MHSDWLAKVDLQFIAIAHIIPQGQRGEGFRKPPGYL